MKKILVGSLLTVLILSGCSSPDESNNSSSCNPANPPTRITEDPYGVLYPSGTFETQSYKSAAEIKAAGFNAVSLGFAFYFNQAGEIVFDRSPDGGEKSRWLERVKCSVVEAKDAGLITLVWGQFEQVDLPRGTEPMGVPEEIREKLAQGAIELMPEIAQLLEELKVEYWSPVSELDKFLGYKNHNKYFRQMVEAGSAFEGITYAQPMTLSLPPAFVTEKVTPDLGGVDALSVSWISFDCRPEDMEKALWIIQQAKDQGVSKIFVGEIGGTQNKSYADQACFETLIAAFEGKANGVIALDLPDGIPNGSQVKGTWQETLITSYVN